MSRLGEDRKVEQGAVLEDGPLVQFVDVFAAVVELSLSHNDSGRLRLVRDIDRRVGGSSDGAVRRNIREARPGTAMRWILTQ